MARARGVDVLLLLPLVAVGSWIVARAGRVRDDPAATLSALRAAQGPALPDPGAVAAVSRAEPERYDRDTLYQYIDGAAEAFLARGFERCAATTYTFRPPGETPFDVAAETYRFATITGAQGQLTAERPASASAVAGVTNAWSDGEVLLAVRGRDLLKLTALTRSPGAGRALTAIARAWRGAP